MLLYISLLERAKSIFMTLKVCLVFFLVAGYRSRVRYFSILDPTQMCYYVSEILDAGLLGPLFMVIDFPLFLSFFL